LTHDPAARCERFGYARQACPVEETAKILQSPLRIDILGESSIEICKFSGNCWLQMRASYLETQDLDLNDRPLGGIIGWDQAFSHALDRDHWLALCAASSFLVP